jgi:hypothetical protein
MTKYALRRWLRRRLIRPLDRWLAGPRPPRKYTLASRHDARRTRQRMLRRLSDELPLPSHALGSST